MALYIDKDFLVAEIERRIRELEPFRTEDNLRAHGAITGYYQVLSFIDTLEVKEVDLEKEVEKYLLTNAAFLIGGDSKLVVHHIAKHFFELGLSVNSPITAADRGTAEEIILALNTLGEEKMISYDKEIEWLNKLKEL